MQLLHAPSALNFCTCAHAPCMQELLQWNLNAAMLLISLADKDLPTSTYSQLV